jgi:FKBP-type peptidyl-prolyl cis-trans isomerase
MTALGTAFAACTTLQIANKTALPTTAGQTPATPRCTPRASASHASKRPRGVSRRAALAAALAAALTAPTASRAIELYKTGTTRYIPQGRPKPTGPPPRFDAGARTFTIHSDTVGDAPNTLEAQDVTSGRGEDSAARGSLVVATWKIFLADGSVVEESDPDMFRVGVAQVYPGLDATLLGMKPGGVRMCRGPAQAFFSDITNGERSLVPSDAEVYATVEMRKLNPFGP